MHSDNKKNIESNKGYFFAKFLLIKDNNELFNNLVFLPPGKLSFVLSTSTGVERYNSNNCKLSR